MDKFTYYPKKLYKFYSVAKFKRYNFLSSGQIYRKNFKNLFFCLGKKKGSFLRKKYRSSFLESASIDNGNLIAIWQYLRDVESLLFQLEEGALEENVLFEEIEENGDTDFEKKGVEDILAMDIFKYINKAFLELLKEKIMFLMDEEYGRPEDHIKFSRYLRESDEV
jgi:hypothetical protein